MRGRPIRGLFGGLLLGICIDLDLAFGGAVRLDSAVLTIIPIALLAVGLILGIWAPIGRNNIFRAPPASPLPPPVAWPEHAPVEGSTAPPTSAPPLGETPPPPPPPI